MTPADITLVRALIRDVRAHFDGRGISGPMALRLADACEMLLRDHMQVEPAAYRIECRWADPALDQTWHKYVDCTSRDAAEFVRSRFRVPGDMETRIVPLYAGTPEESR